MINLTPLSVHASLANQFRTTAKCNFTVWITLLCERVARLYVSSSHQLITLSASIKTDVFGLDVTSQVSCIPKLGRFVDAVELWTLMKCSCCCKNARLRIKYCNQKSVWKKPTDILPSNSANVSRRGERWEVQVPGVNQGHCCHGRLLSSKLRESGGGRGYTHSSLVSLSPPHPLELTFACWAPHLLCSPAEGIRCLPRVGKGYCQHWREGNNHWHARPHYRLPPSLWNHLVSQTPWSDTSQTPHPALRHPTPPCPWLYTSGWMVSKSTKWMGQLAVVNCPATLWSYILTSTTIGPPRLRHKSMYYNPRLSKVLYSQAKARNNLLMH